MQHRKRTDSNQKEIVEALRNVGASVTDLSSVGSGLPDLLCGYRNRTFLIEVKDPEAYYGRKGLTKSQQAFRDSWRGTPPLIAHTPEEALSIIGAI